MFRVVTRRSSCRVQSVSALLIAAAVMFAVARPAAADAVLSAVGGTINAGGPGLTPLVVSFDQSGLIIPYVSGVTNFDHYLLSGPTHITPFFFEWFGNEGSTTASVTYDLGQLHPINRVALWNEDDSGIGLLSLFGSSDGSSFFPLVQDVEPRNNSQGHAYGADVFGFSATALRYVRFDLSECPQPDILPFPACAIGEVAFAEAAAVPEPASAALLGLGLTAVAVMRRRRPTR